MAHKGRVAIVTGGASGIGLGIVKYLLSEGAKVSILDRQSSHGADLAESLGEAALFCEADVTQWSSLYDAFEETAQAFEGRIDFVFANAGISQMTDFRQSHPQHYATNSTSVKDLKSIPPNLAVMEVNLTGVLYTIHLALAYFRQQEPDADGWRGKIVATGSTASIYPFPNDPLYGASKHGVLGLVRALGPKLLSEGITVNALAPPIVRTALGPPDFFDRLEKEGRVTPISTLTNCVARLIDPKSRLTGQLGELEINDFTFRNFPTYLDDTLRSNMNEFWSVDDIDAALKVDNL